MTNRLVLHFSASKVIIESNDTEAVELFVKFCNEEFGVNSAADDTNELFLNKLDAEKVIKVLSFMFEMGLF